MNQPEFESENEQIAEALLHFIPNERPITYASSRRLVLGLQGIGFTINQQREFVERFHNVYQAELDDRANKYLLNQILAMAEISKLDFRS